MTDKEYRKIHVWVKNNKGGRAYQCQLNINHTAKHFHWANISQEYKYDLSDWIMLCPSCHKKYDCPRQFRFAVKVDIFKNRREWAEKHLTEIP